MKRIPRKIKKKIPKGLYCYEGVSYDITSKVYRVKHCPYFTFIKGKYKPINKQDDIDKEYPEEKIQWCKLLECDMDDACKSCGVKMNFR